MNTEEKTTQTTTRAENDADTQTKKKDLKEKNSPTISRKNRTKKKQKQKEEETINQSVPPSTDEEETEKDGLVVRLLVPPVRSPLPLGTRNEESAIRKAA